MYYDFSVYVASDVGIGQRFLPTYSTRTQGFNDGSWIHKNLAKLNYDKFKYVIHTRRKENLSAFIDR